ncbi:MAG: hypothetical protein HQK51_19285 [Oligoflexia bacterium]|nr:hypothetical protein [Oligoflexia bacterium]
MEYTVPPQPPIAGLDESDSSEVENYFKKRNEFIADCLRSKGDCQEKLEIYTKEDACEQLCKKIIEKQNQESRLNQLLKKKEEELESPDVEVKGKINKNPLDISVIGVLDAEGSNESRPIIMVKVKGLSYKTLKGTDESYIPFYLSSGNFSQNRGVWFPFYGMFNRPVSQTNQSPQWLGKGENRYTGKFNLKFTSDKYKRKNIESTTNETSRTPEAAIEYRSRLEDPVIFYLIQRLNKEVQVNSSRRELTYQGEKWPLTNKSALEINGLIKEHNPFGIDLTKVTPTSSSKKIREAQTVKLEEFKSTHPKVPTVKKEKPLEELKELKELRERQKKLDVDIQEYSESIQLPMLEELDEMAKK